MSTVVPFRESSRVARPGIGPDDSWLERASHRRVRRKHMLYRAGQPATAAFLVHAGVYKSTVLDAHGRERVTGFALKGDVLGVEALEGTRYAADVVSLDVGDVIELPRSELMDPVRGMLPVVAASMAAAFERDWRWMLAMRAFDADQRVARFLLDYAARLARRGFPGHRLLLRMTRADIGSFLDLASESVVRAMTRLESAGLIRVSCRDITLLDSAALERLLAPGNGCGVMRAPATASVH